MRKTLLAMMTGLGLAAGAMAQHQHHEHAPAADVGSQGRPQRGAPAAREWTRQPLLVPAGRGGERGAMVLRPIGIEAAELQVFAADGPPEKRRVAVPADPEGARIEPASPKLGNYHWVVARSESEGEVRVASTVVYFSNPGAAPTELLAVPKHELEIVPQPLPREHGAYRESDKWIFLLRMNGAPLPDQAVTLETEFGSRSSFVSDNQGRVVVLFPRDFKPAAKTARESGEEMGPRRAGFVLAAAREEGGKRYLTAFNYSYSPDADRGRSLAWGAAFGMLGMAAATPLLRRRGAKEQEKSDA
ncbi:MAG: hypothetical protein ACM3Y9_01750 [Ignavibacteria bacterium]